MILFCGLRNVIHEILFCQSLAQSVAEPVEASVPTEALMCPKARMVRQAHHPFPELVEVPDSTEPPVPTEAPNHPPGWFDRLTIRSLSPLKRPSPPKPLCTRKPGWFDRLTIR